MNSIPRLASMIEARLTAIEQTLKEIQKDMATYTQAQLRAAQLQLDSGALAKYDLEVQAASNPANSAAATEIQRHLITPTSKLTRFEQGAQSAAPLAAVRTLSSIALSTFAHTTTGTATVTLSGALGAYEGPQTVALSSSDPTKATVPASVDVAVGASTAPVTVTGVAAGSVTITATLNGVSHDTGVVTVS